MQRWQQQQMTHERPIQSERPLADWLGSMNAMQKLSLLQLPIVSDVAGLLGDIQQYREQPESRNLLNYSMTGVGLLPMIPAMTVFHGSPHKWLPEEGFPMGRPRLDKIGTGEGAQAYGHGMYFAESPGVAKSYAAPFNDGLHSLDEQMGRLRVGNDRLLDRYNIDMWPEFLRHAKSGDAKEMARVGKDRLDSWLAYAADPEYKWRDYAREKASAWKSLLPKIEKGDVNFKEWGEMYTLDLPDERIPGLLDWDKPLSQQPENVRAAFRAELESLKRGSQFEKLQDRTGAEILQYIMPSGNKSEAAERLAARGIPGLRYLDAASRGAGNGTSNFVVWDQALLDEMARRMADMASKK